jgi:hypothetical protein
MQYSNNTRTARKGFYFFKNPTWEMRRLKRGNQVLELGQSGRRAVGSENVVGSWERGFGQEGWGQEDRLPALWSPHTKGFREAEHTSGGFCFTPGRPNTLRGVALLPREGRNCSLHPDVETPLDETVTFTLRNVQESAQGRWRCRRSSSSEHRWYSSLVSV